MSLFKYSYVYLCLTASSGRESLKLRTVGWTVTDVTDWQVAVEALTSSQGTATWKSSLCLLYFYELVGSVELPHAN